MSNIKDGSYLVIQSWMITELELKGNELLIYALIYGFSQAEDSFFNGSLQYLADWTNSSRQTVITTLKSLQEKGLIEKLEEDPIKKTYRYVAYRGVKKFDQSKNLTRTSQEILLGESKNLTSTSQKIRPYNIYNNLDNNINTTTTENKIEILPKKESEKSSSSFINISFLKDYTGLANSTRLNILNAFPNLSKENFNSAFNIVKEEYKKGNIKSFDAVLVKYLKGEWNISTSLPGSTNEDDFKFIKTCVFDCLQYLQFGWSNKDLIDKLQRDISGKPLEIQLKAREMLENELQKRGKI